MSEELCGERMGIFGFPGTDAHPDRTCTLPKGHGGYCHESSGPGPWCWWPIPDENTVLVGFTATTTRWIRKRIECCPVGG